MSWIQPPARTTLGTRAEIKVSASSLSALAERYNISVALRPLLADASTPAQPIDPTTSLATCQSPMAYRFYESRICCVRGQRLELLPSALAAAHRENCLTKRSCNHNEDACHH